jgi:hypothetical protein
LWFGEAGILCLMRLVVKYLIVLLSFVWRGFWVGVLPVFFLGFRWWVIASKPVCPCLFAHTTGRSVAAVPTVKPVCRFNAAREVRGMVALPGVR